MPERRRSPQFRAEAVQMVIQTGKPIAEAARDAGASDGTLGNWVKAWRDANPEPEPERNFVNLDEAWVGAYY
jgi:transposase-like protein